MRIGNSSRESNKQSVSCRKTQRLAKLFHVIVGLRNTAENIPTYLTYTATGSTTPIE